MLNSGFYEGTIRHHRYVPRPHQFDYSMYWTLLDLDRLEETFAKNRFWSINQWNLISFREKDFHKTGQYNNKISVIETIKEKYGEDFSGKVYLLSHLRYLGFNFNSVSFYFCIENDELKYIVSEITNTPWGERHPYVLKCKPEDTNNHLFEFKKAFHISPFIEMQMDYRWNFIFSDDSLRIHMVVLKENSNQKIFDATFTADFIPFTQSNMTSKVFKRPFQPLKMVAGIYWQALKLWLKKVPFIEHPKFKIEPKTKPKKTFTNKES